MAEVGSYSQQERGDIITSLQQGKILLCSFSKAADKHIHKEQLKGACCICNSTLYAIALRYMYVHVYVYMYVYVEICDRL